MRLEKDNFHGGTRRAREVRLQVHGAESQLGLGPAHAARERAEEEAMQSAVLHGLRSGVRRGATGRVAGKENDQQRPQHNQQLHG